MRLVVVAALAAAVLALPRVAAASCDGCCTETVTLAGWSEDGTTTAVIHGNDDRGQALVVTGPRATRAWSAWPDDAEPFCLEDVAGTRLPGRAGRDARRIDVRRWKPLRRYDLQPVDAAWRDAFAEAIEVVAVGKRTFRRDPFDLGVTRHHECTAWELRAGGEVIATLPRECADITPFADLDVRGGYLHPSGTAALVKVKIRSMGYRSEERYLRIELP
jgi:hypothetical protein